MQPRFCLLAGLTGLTLFGLNSVSQAQSTSVFSTVVTSTTPSGGTFGSPPQAVNVLLPQFNTQGGTLTLTSIVFAISNVSGQSSADGVLSLQNGNRNSKTATGNYAETLALKLGTNHVVDGSSSTPFSATVSGNTTSAVPLTPLTITGTGPSLLPGNLPSGLTLSDFEGSGDIAGGLHLVVDDTSAFTSHPSIEVASYSSTTTESVSVTYTYTSSVVPEPAFYQMTALLFLGGISVMRVERKKGNASA